jgi:hypothetical protein|tara:strand:- start:5137 stop:5343 length:207 start_codon:yes stop_codon:yes gene_type:complete
MKKTFDFYGKVLAIIEDAVVSRKIKRKDLLREFSFFRIDRKIANKVLRDLQRDKVIEQRKEYVVLVKK